MRWVTYRTNEGERAGLVVDDQIHGLPADTTVLGLLGDDGTRMVEAARQAADAPVETIPLADADLGPPLRPPQMRDFLTFLDHLRNARGGPGTELDPVWHELPVFYFTNAMAVVGPYDPVPISPGCQWWDYELEVAAVVGHEIANATPEEAADAIAGFTIFCDWSACDHQYKEMAGMLGPAKGKDGATTIGPVLVTADELEPFRSGTSYHLEMSGYVNDELVSHGWMDQMDWSWADMLAFASRGTRLVPGEVVGSGTVPTGCLVEHWVTQGDDFRGWLQPGDVVRLEVQELGTIRQEVLPAGPLHPLSRQSP
jgi:2-keto-4-pentenoate hydratase/2-oxohepta-3-ene-1,7-dioic acid hydratase in catechol pathway